MPWYGFFKKVSRADLWIVLDHTKNNTRDAAFWGRRVKLLSHGRPSWISIPLCKPTNSSEIGTPINQMKINRSLHRNFSKTYDTIRYSYSSLDGFSELSDIVATYFTSAEQYLLKCNMSFINQVSELLDIKTPIIYSSTLDPVGSSNDLLIDLLIKVGATSYLCGTGAIGYQRNELYEQKGIRLF